MYILAFFTDAGSPKTGLSALIKIWKVSDDSLLVDDAAMTEIAGGWYKYDYTAYSSSIAYAIRCDANDGTIADYERYRYAGNSECIF